MIPLEDTFLFFLLYKKKRKKWTSKIGKMESWKSSGYYNPNRTLLRCGFGRPMAEVYSHIGNVNFFSIVLVRGGGKKKRKMEKMGKIKKLKFQKGGWESQ